MDAESKDEAAVEKSAEVDIDEEASKKKAEATRLTQEVADFYKQFQSPVGMIPQNREQRRLANRSHKLRSHKKRKPRK